MKVHLRGTWPDMQVLDAETGRALPARAIYLLAEAGALPVLTLELDEAPALELEHMEAVPDNDVCLDVHGALWVRARALSEKFRREGRKISDYEWEINISDALLRAWEGGPETAPAAEPLP